MNLRAIGEFIGSISAARSPDAPRFRGSEAEDALLDWVREQLAADGVDILSGDEVRTVADIVSSAMFAQCGADTAQPAPSPFEEGKAACWSGELITANPYPRSQKEIEWRHGWLAGQEIEHAIESHHSI